MIPPSPVYKKNLAALVRFQPEVAAVVEAALTTADVTPAVGRDGSPTFMHVDSSGRRAWFGQSSMPSISAVETLAGFSSHGGNVVLPGVLTGAEIGVLLARLSTEIALFVAEDDPQQIKLAMHLYDYTPWIDAGRLVIGLSDDLAGRLREFFHSHPGYLLPGRLLTVPQRSAARIADLQRRLESAGEAVAAVHAAAVDRSARKIRERIREAPPTPKVALLGVDARPVSLEQARRIARGLGKLGWPFEVCVPSRPGRCHVAARLAAIERADADVVLFVNGGAGQMVPLLPAQLAPVVWYQPGIAGPLPNAAEPKHLIFAGGSLYRRLLAGGIAAESVLRCEPCADDILYKPSADIGKDSLRTKVAVLMDVPDSRPEAADVTLPSHISLWDALKARTFRNVDHDLDPMMDRLCRDAERESGTQLTDPRIREQFLQLVRGRVVPAAIARGVAETLRMCDCEPVFWGANWTAVCADPSLVRGPIPMGAALNDVFQAADVIVLPDASDLAVQTTLDAIAAGKTVICREAGEPLEQTYPGLATAAPFIHRYRTRRELAECVIATNQSSRGLQPARTLQREMLVSLDGQNNLRGGGRQDRDRASAARAVVLAEHTVAHRLKFIVDCLCKRSP